MSAPAYKVVHAFTLFWAALAIAIITLALVSAYARRLHRHAVGQLTLLVLAMNFWYAVSLLLMPSKLLDLSAVADRRNSTCLVDQHSPPVYPTFCESLWINKSSLYGCLFAELSMLGMAVYSLQTGKTTLSQNRERALIGIPVAVVCIVFVVFDPYCHHNQHTSQHTCEVNHLLNEVVKGVWLALCVIPLGLTAYMVVLTRRAIHHTENLMEMEPLPINSFDRNRRYQLVEAGQRVIREVVGPLRGFPIAFSVYVVVEIIFFAIMQTPDKKSVAPLFYISIFLIALKPLCVGVLYFVNNQGAWWELIHCHHRAPRGRKQSRRQSRVRCRRRDS